MGICEELELKELREYILIASAGKQETVEHGDHSVRFVATYPR
jgi:hypothetical protein